MRMSGTCTCNAISANFIKVTPFIIYSFQFQTNDVWLSSRVIMIESTPRGPKFRRVRRRINFSSEDGDGACATRTPAASPQIPADTTIAEESLQQRVLRLEESLEALRKEMEGRRILRKLNVCHFCQN
nr:uncharacterized protein LOC109620164 isoform X1 [Crassostrea gigas]